MIDTDLHIRSQLDEYRNKVTVTGQVHRRLSRKEGGTARCTKKIKMKFVRATVSEHE